MPDRSDFSGLVSLIRSAGKVAGIYLIPGENYPYLAVYTTEETAPFREKLQVLLADYLDNHPDSNILTLFTRETLWQPEVRPAVSLPEILETAEVLFEDDDYKFLELVPALPVAASLKEFEKNIETVNNNPGYLFEYLAVRLKHPGDFSISQVTDDFNRAVELSAGNYARMRRLTDILTGKIPSEMITAKKPLTTMLYNLFVYESETGNFSRAAEITGIISRYADPDGLMVIEPYLQFELGKIFLKMNDYLEADKIFLALLDKAPSDQRFELYFKIADEYLDEGLKEKSIAHFILALEYCDNRENIDDQVLLAELLTDLCTDTGDYQAAEHYAGFLGTLAERLSLEDKKFVSLLKKVKIRYLEDNKRLDSTFAGVREDIGAENFEFMLFRNIVNNLNNQLTVLPLRFKSLKSKFSPGNLKLLLEKKAAGNYEVIRPLFGSLTEYLVINLQMLFLEYLFKKDLTSMIERNDPVIILFLKAKIAEEFKNYREAAKITEKLLKEFYKNKDENTFILNCLRTYGGYLRELNQEHEAASQMYAQAHNFTGNQTIGLITEMHSFFLKFCKNEENIDPFYLAKLMSRIDSVS